MYSGMEAKLKAMTEINIPKERPKNMSPKNWLRVKISAAFHNVLDIVVSKDDSLDIDSGFNRIRKEIDDAIDEFEINTKFEASLEKVRREEEVFAELGRETDRLGIYPETASKK